jgi:alkylhydroperoxidase/carboxymuconolactone decarboxylase family protein YurZ
MSNLGKASPELAEWMMVDGYSKVLSRPGPTALEREIASIVFLAISGHQVQLHSHVRGARNLGATPEFIKSALGAGVLSREQTVAVETKVEQVFRK